MRSGSTSGCGRSGVFKTRSAATDACTSGRVTVGDDVAKPATKVRAGDTVTVHRRDRNVVYVVVEPIAKRVSAARAAECYDDHSPPLPERDPLIAPPGGARARGEGRPTKRDRRRLDHLRGR